MLFPVIVLAAAWVVWRSLDTVEDVSDKTNALVDRHIPELREIAALQEVMNRALISLHEYYATTEHPGTKASQQLADEFKSHLSALRTLNSNDRELSGVEAPVAEFRRAASQFDGEMRRGSARDWDRLREHLADATTRAASAIDRLRMWNDAIRIRASEGGKQTLTEVARLNTIQLGFGLTVLLVAISLLGFLYARMRDQAKLLYVAMHDDLTGLPNRQSLREHCGQACHSEYDAGRTAVIWLGLDRIGLISGTFGHELGDALLRSFSSKLEALLESNNVHAHMFSFGRADWVIFIDELGTTLGGLETVRLIEELAARPLPVGERELNVSCSIGLTYFDTGDRELDQVLKEADTARRAAHDAGGNAYRVYETVMTRSAENFLTMESALRKALQRDEFELHYQPKVLAKTGEVHCAEALLRWNHEGRPISPGEFIPVAERTGLVVPIGTWVLEHVCQRWVARLAQGESVPPVAVNISAQQFQAADFPAQVATILAISGMPPAMLELEITEEAASLNPEHVVESIRALKDIGVTLAIDDFGTGYSSLSYLKRFPIDVLKIDRAFIAPIDDAGSDRAIVRMVIELAHELGFSVVAEGVETEEQSRLLGEMSCDLLQGFLFSRPLAETDFFEFSQSRAGRLQRRLADVAGTR